MSTLNKTMHFSTLQQQVPFSRLNQLFKFVVRKHKPMHNQQYILYIFVYIETVTSHFQSIHFTNKHFHSCKKHDFSKHGWVNHCSLALVRAYQVSKNPNMNIQIASHIFSSVLICTWPKKGSY